MKCKLIVLLCLGSLLLQAHNIGIGSNSPETKLYVDGAIGSVPASISAGTTILIPDNVSIIRVTDNGASNNNVASVNNPKEGQFLTIYNADGQNVSFGSFTIKANSGTGSFVYINGAWRLIADNTAGTGGYVITLGHSNTNLLKNSTYVCGASFDLAAITLFNDRPSRRANVPTAGQVKSIQVNTYVTGTLAGVTNDSYTMRVRNITQNTQQDFVTNFGLSSGNLTSQSRIDNYVLSTPLGVNAGDIIQIQILTPNWTTEPIGVFQKFNVYIE